MFYYSLIGLRFKCPLQPQGFIELHAMYGLRKEVPDATAELG